jgi:hypothetical protein
MNTTGEPQTPRQKLYLARLAAAKERLLAALEGLNEQTLTTEPVVGDWTVKDMLGHIVSWNDEFRREIKLILEGNHPGYELVISGADDFAGWNQHCINKKRGRSWAQMMDDLEQDFDWAAQLILALSPLDYRQRGVTPWKQAALTRPAAPTREDTDSVDTLVTFHWRHSNQHVRMIERWRKQRQG